MCISSLLSEKLSILSGGRTPTERLSESRAIGIQRRLNMIPLRLNYEVPALLSPEKENASDEVTFFNGDNSPQTSPRPCSISPSLELGLLSPETSPQRFIMNHVQEVIDEEDENVENFILNKKHHHNIDDHDGSSMDSGYSASGCLGLDITSNDNQKFFKFTAPSINQSQTTITTVPRRLDMTNSPKSISPKLSPKSNFKLYNHLSTGSIESEGTDEELLDLMDMEGFDDENNLPSNLSNLISGSIKSIKTTPETKRPLVRRCLSLTENEKVYRKLISSPRTPETVLRSINENLTPYSSRVENSNRCFKRPEPPVETPIQNKRYRTEDCEMDKENIVQRVPLRKSMSMNDAVIMNALAKCKFK